MFCVLVKGQGGDLCLLIAIRDGAKVISHYSLVIHDTIVLGHHACVDNGSQLSCMIMVLRVTILG